MTFRRLSPVLGGFAVLAVIAPVAIDNPVATASPPVGVKGTGKVVGTAVLKVIGGGTATVTWKENDGTAHIEKDVALPWEHTIDVVEEANSEVRANGTGATGCTITMGDMLVSFKSEPNPVCEFAYWG
ncbi:hypothetical protein MSTE_04986 [Mycobacteroides stephanolepidis]|uniref:Uncharacterized protein n=1 Tax=[Mycobacterium] stephanolepidis TaxID=1520670 RepID=A0A1Z4F513_9MYCO|nr:hypothetical protein [[Mycobacterium] stephanolepidis]BAY00278.1 hypothetical protein MSTE_04986 [[Mycobacterium] stephanolepidis]